MGGKNSAPKAPDPYDTANAQAASNRDTAITEYLLNTGTQVNPWGTVSYAQDGTRSFVDSNGKTVTMPSFTQTTKFTPEQQAIFDASQGAQKNLAGLAQNLSGQAASNLANPFTYNNHDAENWAFDLASQRITPQLQQQRAALETQLANQGVTPGSRAWEAAIAQSNQGQNDAYNQLALNGRSQAFNEALTMRNQPINEITALLSGSQVSNPAAQSQGMPQVGVGGTDVAGIIQNGYQNQLQASQSGGNALGGLFGLGSSVIGAAGNAGGFGSLFSDERLKKDIKRVGTTDAGIPIYTYRYVWGGPIHMGVMARDVPNAAHMTSSGFLAVDYAEVR